MGFKKEWKCLRLIFNTPVLLRDRWRVLQGTVAFLAQHIEFDRLPLSLSLSPSARLFAATIEK